MRKVILVAVLVAGIVLLGLAILIRGMADGGTATPPPSAGEAAPGAAQAVVLQDVPVRTLPDGPPATQGGGLDPLILATGSKVTLLGSAIGATGQWVRVYVLPSSETWPSDIYAWLPVALNGRAMLDVKAAIACPDELTLAALATLSPQDRLRCAGNGELVLEGRTTFNDETIAYDVSPEFFGGVDAPTAVGLSPDAGAWLGAGRPSLPVNPGPGVPALPVDFDLRGTGHFDFAGAAACRRSQPASMGTVPVEAAADSADWCRSRFVLTAWEVVNGPERRPPVAGEIQLHRHPAFDACGGVGMAGLTLHIDPTAVDQVWLTAGGRAQPILASFSDVFTAVVSPVPSIIDDKGLVLTDGMSINPDANLGGHMVCPSGTVVYFG